MRTFLDRMRNLKNEEILKRSSQVSLLELREQAQNLELPVPFVEAFRRKDKDFPNIIAEVKARAPGKVNVQDLDPKQVVQDYSLGGASAVSVLTDETWFGGSLQTLYEVRNHIDLPLLHKEFIISEYQLLEGRIRGASASLLLVYYFDQKELSRMMKQCWKLNLEPIVECSLEKELPRALDANPKILMINNRPIASIPEDPSKTYQQGSVDVTIEWWKKNKKLRDWKTQSDRVLISASCIAKPYDVERLMEIPCDACLVGNNAMTANDRVSFLKSLRGKTTQ